MLKSLAFVEWIHLYVWHKTATARLASRNKTITKTSLQCASPDQHANDCSFIEIQWMYISKHWSTEPIQRHFIHLQLAFCYLHALFMRSNYNGIRPKTRTCSCRNSQSRWSRTVHFVVDFHVKSAYNSKTNLFTRKTLQCSGPIFKKSHCYITCFYNVHFFLVTQLCLLMK